MSCALCGSDKNTYLYHDYQDNRYVKCNDCGLVYQDPPKIIEYEDNYWGEIVDPDGKRRVLANERKQKIKNWYGDAIKFVSKLPSGRILDVGCGLGFFLSAIDSSWEKYGIEISQHAVNFIRENFKDIQIHGGTLEDASFETNFFDVVLFYHVVEHLEKPIDALRLINKYLKRGKILIIGTPNIDSFCARRFKGNFRLLGDGHLNLFSPRTLDKLLRMSKFETFRREYPFFKTDYFTFKNLLRLLDTSKISPAFYRNIMTFYARKIDEV